MGLNLQSLLRPSPLRGTSLAASTTFQPAGRKCMLPPSEKPNAIEADLDRLWKLGLVLETRKGGLSFLWVTHGFV
jgi:hypothetical protein